MTEQPDDETRVRELLRAAVPEAPEVTPPARTTRSRGPLVAVLAAAAAVAAIVVVPLTVGGDDGDRTAVTLPESTAERTPLPVDPYTVDPCPPAAPRSPPFVADLADATSIRLCSWPVEPGLEAQAPSPGLQVPDDALVTGLQDLAGDALAIPGAERDPCATISYFDPYDTSVVITGPDGRAVLSASPCESVTIDGARDSALRINGGDLANLVVEALGRQRATAEYPPFYYSFTGSDMSVWCDAPTTLAPVQPIDSDLAGAVLCPDYNVARATPTPLDDAALERLREAWRATDDPAVDEGFDGYDDEQAHVVALTSYGDLVRMVPKEGVDGLTLVVPRQGFGQPTAVVPTTLEELTRD